MRDGPHIWRMLAFLASIVLVMAFLTGVITGWLLTYCHWLGF